MAIDKRLQIKDEQGNLVDYDILASDVKFLPDGKDLPTKLAEMDDAIDEAGSGDGTVTGVKIGSTTYEPTDGVVDLSSPMSNKVDKETGKGLSTNDYTTEEKTKLGSLPTNPVQTISVNGGTPATPINGNVDISVEGVVPHIGSNGHWFIGETDTGINATGNDGQSITDADLVIGNSLNGQGNVLGMSGAMRIKSNIDSLYASLNRLYSKLANMAFWDATDQAAAAPTAMDWSIPNVTVTITNSIGAGAVIKNGTEPITFANGSASIQVEQGSELTLNIEAASSYVLSSVAATVDGDSETVTESSGVYTLEIASVDANTAIVISGTATEIAPLTATFSTAKTIYTCDELSWLKQFLTVKDDQDQTIASADYSLSGTLTVGTSTLTVTYGNDTCQFTISNVQAGVASFYNFVNGKGINNTNNTKRSSYLYLDKRMPGGKRYTFNIDVNYNTTQCSFGHYNQIVVNNADANNMNNLPGNDNVFATSWLNQGDEWDVQATTNDSPIVGAKVTIRSSSSDTDLPSDFFVERVVMIEVVSS